MRKEEERKKRGDAERVRSEGKREVRERSEGERERK